MMPEMKGNIWHVVFVWIGRKAKDETNCLPRNDAWSVDESYGRHETVTGYVCGSVT
jgi:hypothetical protein